MTGDVPAAELGHTAPHEHLLSDSSAQARALHAGGDDALVALGIRPEDREMLVAPMAMGNLAWVRRHAMNVENLRLDDEPAAGEALAAFRALGGQTVVDCTPVGLARNPSGLRRLAEVTGTTVVMGSGWYLQPFHPPEVAASSIEELRDVIVADLEVGVGETGVRAGIIGEIGTGWPLHPEEARVLAAAALAQRQTGAGVQVHPGRHPEAPLACLRVLQEHGADLTKVSVSHLDRTLTDVAQLVELAATGCYLELDMFGQESTYYPYGPFEVPNDGARVRMLEDLVAVGLTDQLLISQDTGYRTLLPRWGGAGYAHVLREVLPLMRRRGWPEDTITALTRTNPARWLSRTRGAS